MVELTLLVPGLAETMKADPDGARFPALERLLTRSDRYAVSSADGDELLLEQFGMVPAADADAPIAPLSLLGDGGEPGDGWWLRSDPVHLQADQDRLLLVGAEQLALTAIEAKAYCAALNAHFADRGLVFLCPHPQRWYLRLDTEPRVRTRPLGAVLGRNVHAHLPTGPEAPRWRALLNEVQMLLHGSEPNDARNARGAPPVNSVWFFGAGRLPHSCSSRFASLCGDAALVRGLARCAGTECCGVPIDGGAWLQQITAGTHLISFPAITEAGAAELFAQRWAAPLWRALRRGRLQRLALWPGGGQWFRAAPSSIWRFWRRTPVWTS